MNSYASCKKVMNIFTKTNILPGNAGFSSSCITGQNIIHKCWYFVLRWLFQQKVLGTMIFWKYLFFCMVQQTIQMLFYWQQHAKSCLNASLTHSALWDVTWRTGRFFGISFFLQFFLYCGMSKSILVSFLFCWFFHLQYSALLIFFFTFFFFF